MSKADDELVKCYGVDCDKCSEQCQLKAAGKSAIHDSKEDKYRRKNLRAKSGHSFISYEDLADENQIIPTRSFSAEETNVYELAKADAIREIVFFYLEHPTEFEVLVKKIYLDKNQTAVALEKGVTRAAISKRIKEEQHSRLKREIAQLKEKNSFFLSLTGRELEVYQLLFVDGCTERATAMQLNISKSTVHRLGQNLRRKLNASGAKSRRRS